MVRVVRFAVLTIVGITMAAPPAGAQTDTSDTTTTTTTPPDSETTTTTSPDPGVDGDAPPESVPDVSITVPPRESTPGGVAPWPGESFRSTCAVPVRRRWLGRRPMPTPSPTACNSSKT